MPSPEGAPSGGRPEEETPPVGAPETPAEETPAEETPAEETPAEEAEKIGEKERKTYEARGEKVLTAEKRAELMRRREAIVERQREIEKEIEMLLAKGAKVSDDAEAAEVKAGLAAAAAAAEDLSDEEDSAIAETPAEATADSGEGTPEEMPTREDIESTKGRAKKSGGFRRFAAAVCAIIAAAAIGIGSWMTGLFGGDKDTTDPSKTGSRPAVETTTDGAPSAAVALETAERERGIYDGYGEKGMYLSEHKTSPVAFANATEVAEVCDDDEVEMIKYTAHNQVESFADYLANLPEELQPDGFKGLSILETVAK